MSGIVIALGGNALGNTVEQQKRAVSVAARAIADIAAMGEPLVIVHGNGPQVGMISAAMRSASHSGDIAEDMPLAECVAMSQGYIGFHLQAAINDALHRRALNRSVCTLVTQMIVDPHDPAFSNPTKPVGFFYTKEEAHTLMEASGELFKEDAGRGWRRVVASPMPRELVERNALRSLCDSGMITICGGGGGIPIVRGECGVQSVSAVIDKDHAAALLAETIDAELLMILTGVSGVYLNYNTPRQRMLERLTAEKARRYCDAGSFAAGSMLPKVDAALRFAERGGTSIITSLEEAPFAIAQHRGTWIVGGRSTRHDPT